MFYLFISFSAYQYWSAHMHGGSGIILEALKLEEIDIFQNFFFHAGWVIWSINNTTQKKKKDFSPEIIIHAL